MDATNLLQLAVSLVMDLKLDRSSESVGAVQRNLLAEAWTLVEKRPLTGFQVVHTSADRRAVLGLYHISAL